MSGKNSTVSNADRERIIACYENQKKIAEISSTLNIKRTTVHQIIKLYQQTGRVNAIKRGSPSRKKLGDNEINAVRSWIDVDSTLSLNQIAARINEDFGVSVSKSTVGRLIESFNYSLKRLQFIPERRNAENTIQIRREYALEFSSLPANFSEEEIIFLNEVGFSVSSRSSRGRTLKGTPAVAIVPAIRTRNISICCAMNRNGILFYKTSTRAFNGEIFIEFLKELKDKIHEKRLKNIVLIMDNVRFHHMNEVKALLDSFNYRILYLPPYSPFLNPIENMFSKWKEITKRTNPSNETDLMTAISNGSQLVTSDDCVGFFRHMWTYIPRCLNEEEILF